MNVYALQLNASTFNSYGEISPALYFTPDLELVEPELTFKSRNTLGLELDMPSGFQLEYLMDYNHCLEVTEGNQHCEQQFSPQNIPRIYLASASWHNDAWDQLVSVRLGRQLLVDPLTLRYFDGLQAGFEGDYYGLGADVGFLPDPLTTKPTLERLMLRASAQFIEPWLDKKTKTELSYHQVFVLADNPPAAETMLLSDPFAYLLLPEQDLNLTLANRSWRPLFVTAETTLDLVNAPSFTDLRVTATYRDLFTDGLDFRFEGAREKLSFEKGSFFDQESYPTFFWASGLNYDTEVDGYELGGFLRARQMISSYDLSNITNLSAGVNFEGAEISGVLPLVDWATEERTDPGLLLAQAEEELSLLDLNGFPAKLKAGYGYKDSWGSVDASLTAFFYGDSQLYLGQVGGNLDLGEISGEDWLKGLSLSAYLRLKRDQLSRWQLPNASLGLSYAGDFDLGGGEK